MSDFELFSPTKIQAYTFCPWKFYLQHIKEIMPARASLPMVRGRIGHDVLSNGIEHFNDLFDSAIEFYRANENTGVRFPLEIDDTDADKMRVDLFEILKNAINMCEIMGLKQLKVEETMQFSIGDYKFEGTTDVIGTLSDTPEGFVEIFDWKFGRRQTPAQLNRNLQHGLYYAGCRQNGLKVWRNWWVDMGDFLPYKKNTKTAKAGDLRGVGFYSIKIDDADLPYIESQTSAICGLINAGIFPQNSYGPSSPCSYCEFEGTGECPRFISGTPKTED